MKMKSECRKTSLFPTEPMSPDIERAIHAVKSKGTPFKVASAESRRRSVVCPITVSSVRPRTGVAAAWPPPGQRPHIDHRLQSPHEEPWVEQHATERIRRCQACGRLAFPT